MARDLLLATEAQMRSCADVTELRHLLVNETRKLNGARQIFLLEVGANARLRTSAVSGIGTFDPSSLLIEDVARVARRLREDQGSLGVATTFTLPAYASDTLELARAYPFRECAWVPLLDRDGRVFAGLVCAREGAWSRAEVELTARVAGTGAHAWRALAPPSRWSALAASILRWRTVLAVALGVALVIPVPLTALAPVEVVARDPDVVAAPIDGVIETIDVMPSATVRKGDVLVRLSDTTLRNRRDIAAQDVAVAEARVKQATLLAFSDPKGHYDLGIAQADLALKRAELAYTIDQLSRTLIRATKDGIAVFADKRSLIGKPVATGERLMEVADPGKVELRIDVAAQDAIALHDAASVRVFLDVEPLAPRSARMTRMDYKARPSDADVLSFRAFATLEPGSAPPRLGLRGTAQVIGEPAPLGVVLFRRPISAVRQWLGL